MALLGVALTALFIVLTIVDTERQHSSRRAIWLGVLMGVAFDTPKMTRSAPRRTDCIRWRSRSVHRDKGLPRCCCRSVTLQACLQQRLEGADSLQVP